MNTLSLKNFPELQSLPMKLKNNIDLSPLFDFHTFAVAVQYCVLRPQKKDNT